MLSIANEIDPLIFQLRMFCMQYKHAFFQHPKRQRRVKFSQTWSKLTKISELLRFDVKLGKMLFRVDFDLV